MSLGSFSSDHEFFSTKELKRSGDPGESGGKDAFNGIFVADECEEIFFTAGTLPDEDESLINELCESTRNSSLA